jgi:hypothetical protein
MTTTLVNWAFDLIAETTTSRFVSRRHKRGRLEPSPRCEPQRRPRRLTCGSLTAVLHLYSKKSVRYLSRTHKTSKNNAYQKPVVTGGLNRSLALSEILRPRLELMKSDALIARFLSKLRILGMILTHTLVVAHADVPVLLVLAIKLGKETHPIFPIIFVKRPLLQEPLVLLQPVRVKELLARIAHFLPFKVIQNVVIKRRIGAIEDGPQRHLYEI